MADSLIAPGSDEPLAPIDPPRFTLSGLLAMNSLLGILFAIPIVGGGLLLAGGILLGLALLQLPLFYLLGAFGPRGTYPEKFRIET